MTIEKLMGQHRSKPRNTNSASVFYKASFIESWGRGISKITDGFAAAGLKAPEFKEDCGGMLVTLYRNTNLANGLSSVESAEEVPKSAEEVPKNTEEYLMSALEKVIYEYVLENKMVTTSLVCELIGVKERRARKVLSEMCDKGYFRKCGATSNLKYILKDE